MKGVLTRAWHLRAWHGKRYVLRHPFNAARFLLFSREVTNFTYDVSNLDELVAFVARHTGATESTARGFIDEILHDQEFHGWLAQTRRKTRGERRTTRIGRRAGWYALARIVKPKVIIETGTHDGLGSS